MKRKFVLYTGAMLAVLLLASCATTTSLTSVWKDGAYHTGMVNKVMVVGVFKKEPIRRIFEDDLVNGFKSRGIDAIPGYTLIPPGKKPDRKSIEALVKRLGFDGVVISRLVGKKTVQTYYPPTRTYVGPFGPYGLYPAWPDYYYDSFDYISSPGYSLQKQEVSVETSLYDVKTGELVWSALSESVFQNMDQQIITSLVDTIMKQMKRDGVP